MPSYSRRITDDGMSFRWSEFERETLEPISCPRPRPGPWVGMTLDEKVAWAFYFWQDHCGLSRAEALKRASAFAEKLTSSK